MNSKEVLTECPPLLSHLYVVTCFQPQLGGNPSCLPRGTRWYWHTTTSRLGSESAQSQADWDSEEPDLMKNVPSHGRRDGLEWFPKVTCSSKQSVILWKSFQGSILYQVYIWSCSLCSHVRTAVMLLELCSLFRLAYRFSWCSELWISHSQAVQSHLYSPHDSWIRSVRGYAKFLTCKEVFNPVLTIWLGFFSVSRILY